jgi:group I intron endonuclease
MVGGIYKIENLIDGKVYIGSSINIISRKQKHFWMLKKGIHDNCHLQHSYNKFGEDSFIFEVLEECNNKDLIIKENYHIFKYKSNNSEFGYNLATVNEFRRNTYNNEVKVKLSKYNLTKNGNFNTYSLTNIQTNKEHTFNTLVDGANYLIQNGFAKGKSRNVRMKLSNSLRGIKVNNGSKTETIRKTCYKHNFNIIN